MSNQEEKPLRQITKDSFTTAHLEQSSEVFRRTQTTSHINEKVNNQNAGNSGNAPSQSGSGQAGQSQSQQQGSSEKKG